MYDILPYISEVVPLQENDPGSSKKNNNSREEESGQGKPSRPDEEEKATAKCSDEMEHGPAKQSHSYFEGTESKDDEPHSLKKRNFGQHLCRWHKEERERSS